MAPSSQMFSQGGIRSRDWFSDRLDRRDNTDGDSFTQFALHIPNAAILGGERHLFTC